MGFSLKGNLNKGENSNSMALRKWRKKCAIKVKAGKAIVNYLAYLTPKIEKDSEKTPIVFDAIS